MKYQKKNDLQLCATNLTKEIAQPCNAKEDHEYF